MILKEGKRLDKARKLIQENKLVDSDNMIWFVSYIIGEYLEEKGLANDYFFVPDTQVDDYLCDSLGVHRKEYWEAVFYMNKRHMHFDLQINSEEFMWFMINQFGHFLLRDEMSKKLLDNVFTFGNPAGYGEKLYNIQKESMLSGMVETDENDTINDFFLCECESSIQGGSIFLDIIEDNFKDEKNLFNIRSIIEWKIKYYTLNKCSVERLKLNNVFDMVISKCVGSLLDEDSAFNIEFNKNGTKKNVFELIEYRERAKDNLLMQKEYYSDLNIKNKIDSILSNNDELLEVFVYNSLCTINNDSFMSLLSLLSEEDVLFIKNSIAHRKETFQKYLSIIEENVEDGDPSMDKDINYWEDEIMNAIRLLELIKGNALKLKID